MLFDVSLRSLCSKASASTASRTSGQVLDLEHLGHASPGDGEEAALENENPVAGAETVGEGRHAFIFPQEGC